MGFLYFVPLAEEGGEALIEATGLSYATSGQKLGYRDVLGQGPNGQGGKIIAVGSASNSPGFFPDSQVWIPTELKYGDNNVWVGMASDTRMLPDDLIRNEVVDGSDIALQDDNRWHVPLIRMFFDDEGDTGYATMLPRQMGVDPEALEQGKYKLSWSAIAPRYQPLLDIAFKYYEWFSARTMPSEEGEKADPEPHEYDDAEALTRAAVDVLSANYRIRLPEATLLNLFDSNGVYAQHVLNYAALDWGNLSAWLKKKQPADGLSTSVGSKTDHSPDTNRHLPITLQSV